VAVGGGCGATAAVIWAISLAIYQPLMEPSGMLTDSLTGQAYPNLASNNTYWPRDIRLLAILLAFAGVILLSRVTVRGIVTGAVASVAWLGADLGLDRLDVSGSVAWLAAAGVAGFTLTAVIAERISRGQPGSDLGQHLAAGTAAVLAAATLLVTGPWDEPVTNPDQVAIENALTLLKVGLVVMFLVATVGLVADRLTAARMPRVAALLAVAGIAGWLAVGVDGPLRVLGLIALPVAASVAVIAARDVTPTRLLLVAVGCVAMLPIAAVLLFIVGLLTGGAMTSLAGNPAVNAADTDLSLALPGLAIGLLLAAVSYQATPSGDEQPRRRRRRNVIGADHARF